MATKRSRVRRTRITVGFVEVSPGWANSVVKLKDYSGNEVVEVVVTIKDPWALSYLRRELDKIAAYWKEKAAL